jgi:hypothetical protein
MRGLVFIVSLLGLVAVSPALARDTRPSLCTGEEVAIFSCAVGPEGKILSLCASPDLSETAGTLAYRFGRKERLELTHPQGEAASRTAFRRGMVGAAGGDFIRFSRGDTTYTLVYTDGPRLPYFAGVEVHRGTKRIAALRCRKDPLGDDAFALLYRGGLPSEIYELD